MSIVDEWWKDEKKTEWKGQRKKALENRKRKKERERVSKILHTQ